MPYAPRKGCLEPGCPRLVERGSQRSRCAEHDGAFRQAQEASRGTAAERGYGHAWRILRLQILERDGYRCQIDGCTEEAVEVDHITPKSEGGTDDPGNLRAACRTHHASKTGRERQRLGMRDRR